MENLTDLELLTAFVAVAEERHFRRAAERVHVTQPVISRRIQRLERAMGVQLLERSSRHVTLTEAGVTFLDSARQLLHAADLAVTRARAVAQGGAGRLTVGFVESVAFELLTPLLHQLDEVVPDVALELRELSTERQLSELEIDVDIAIVRELGERELLAEGIQAQHLLQEPLMLAVSLDHPLATRSRVGLKQLRDEPFVLFPRPPVPRLHDHLLSVCEEAGFRPTIAAHAWQYPTMLAMVAAARGAALVPRCTQAIRPPQVRLVPLTDRHAITNLSLAWRGAGTPALTTFVEAARSVAAATAAASDGRPAHRGPRQR